MLKAIQIQPDAVGRAFQQQLGAVPSVTEKRRRKSEFVKLRQVLMALRLVPVNFDMHHIAWGVDKNGNETILVAGEHKLSTIAADCAQRA